MQGEYFLLGQYGLRFRRGTAGDLSHDADFFLFGGILDVNLEHETIELSFRQGVGTFLFEGVLSRQDEEGRVKFEVFSASRHHLLLHGLQKGGLRLRWRPVDFVR